MLGGNNSALVKKSILSLKNNKSPGNDGLTSEFFKLFIDKISVFLLAVYEEPFVKEELPPSLKQGTITLIPKPNKDSLTVIDNWHLIILLNNDYKIIGIQDLTECSRYSTGYFQVKVFDLLFFKGKKSP